MASTGSPAWRRAFDTVERRLSPPLASATSSTELQVASQMLRRATGAVARPVDGIVSWGLHLAGLPSYADIRSLKRQLTDVQREVLALRRQLSIGYHEGGSP